MSPLPPLVTASTNTEAISAMNKKATNDIRPTKNQSGLNRLGLWGILALGLILIAGAVLIWQKGNIFKDDEPVYFAQATIVDRYQDGMIIKYSQPLPDTNPNATVKIQFLPGIQIAQKTTVTNTFKDKDGKSRESVTQGTKYYLPSQIQLNLEVLIHSPKDLRGQSEIGVDSMEILKAN